MLTVAFRSFGNAIDNETHFIRMYINLTSADKIKQESLRYVYAQERTTVFQTQVKVTEISYPNI